MIGKAGWTEESKVRRHLDRLGLVTRLLGLPFDSPSKLSKSAICYAYIILLIKAGFLGEFVYNLRWDSTFFIYYNITRMSTFLNDFTILYNVSFKRSYMTDIRKALEEVEESFHLQNIKWKHKKFCISSFYDISVLLYWVMNTFSNILSTDTKSVTHFAFNVAEILFNSVKEWIHLCFSVAVFCQFRDIHSLTQSLLTALTAARADPAVCLHSTDCISAVVNNINVYFGITIFFFISTNTCMLLIGLYLFHIARDEFLTLLIFSTYVITSIVSCCYITNLKVLFSS